MGMTPQLINIRDLQVGDEVIISGNSNLKYLKILTPPREGDRDEWSMKTQADGTRKYAPTGRKRLKSFRCSTRQDEIKFTTEYTKKEYYKKKYVFEPDVSKHNKKISIDLSDRDVLLVKREKE